MGDFPKFGHIYGCYAATFYCCYTVCHMEKYPMLTPVQQVEYCYRHTGQSKMACIKINYRPFCKLHLPICWTNSNVHLNENGSFEWKMFNTVWLYHTHYFAWVKKWHKQSFSGLLTQALIEVGVLKSAN